MHPKVRNVLTNLSDLGDSPMGDYRDAILGELCVLTDSQLSYVAAMNREEDVRTMVGWSRTDMEYCGIIDKPIVHELQHTGLWGNAVRERQVVITNDCANLDKPTYPQGNTAVMNHMILPIFEGDRIALVVGVGNKTGDYNFDDAQIVEQMMSEVWYSFKMSLWEAAC